MLSLGVQLAANLFLWIWLMGAALLLWSRALGRRNGKLWVLYLGLVWLLATRPVSESLLRPLEDRFSQPSISELRAQRVERVVVLTGGGYTDRWQTLSSALPPASLYRLLGGIEICTRLGPDCQLLLSGSAGRGSRETKAADTMEELARLLGPDSKIEAESLSGSTAEHPANTSRILGDEPFTLVTSAYHMPRSIRSFRRHGLNPIPYPVDFQVLGSYSWTDWLPSTDAARKAQLAFREYLATILYTLQGW